MKKSTRNSLMLVLTAMIWGVAFVAQSAGGDAVGPYTFNCVRNILGAMALWIAMKPLDTLGFTGGRNADDPIQAAADRRNLILGGICCGICLGIASNLQQLGINVGDSVGKAGFLTTCYIVLVPLLGMVIGRKCPVNVWVGVLITVCGLYLLCIRPGADLKFQSSDLLLLACALGFSVHILVIDHFSPLTEGVRLSCIQFIVAAIVSAIPMILVEMRPHCGGFAAWLATFGTKDAWIPILYAGLCSSGIGYTLQVIGQNEVNPTVASLLMSLESVFSVIAGAWILGEYMSSRELTGCLLIFVAVVIAQLPLDEWMRRRSA